MVPAGNSGSADFGSANFGSADSVPQIYGSDELQL